MMEVLNSAGLEINIQNKSDDERTLNKQKPLHNVATYNNSDSSDDETGKVKSKRVQRLSDSDSSRNGDDITTALAEKRNPSSPAIIAQNCSSGDEKLNHSNNTKQKSRVRTSSSGSDSENLPDSTSKSRIENKQIKLKNKFKNLHKRNKNNVDETKHDASCSSADSDNDLNSIEKIKQTLKERNQYLKSTLYDPDTDTSDEEPTQNHQGKISRMKKERKLTKLISPKPMRMTAKDAMENMQKIKSESNRLLREKEVSLPYHKPKALTLKDIMSKRRPAVAADGKALPIKMNEEQLKHYVQILEERQKEVIQLCKSDTEEEEDLEKENENTDTVGDANVVSYMDVDADSENINQSLVITSDNLYDDLKSYFEGKDCTIETQGSDNKVLNEQSVIESHEPDQIVFDNTKNDQIESNLIDTQPNNDTILLANIKNDQKQTELIDTQLNKDSESQLQLHYTEDSQTYTEVVDKLVTDQVTTENNINDESKAIEDKEETTPVMEEKEDDTFSDADIDMEYIDSIIENADIIKDGCSDNPLNVKPKLTGAPGTVIDLDDTDATAPKNLSGVELLKERYIFFSKLKTPEEIEREKEKRVKPGTLHLKLKHELEEKMAEQRSLEWSKRLEQEKAQHMETEGTEEQEEDDIEKLEAKIEQDAEVNDAEDPESEEEIVEDDCDMVDKPRKRNPLLDDEAEVSDEDEDATLAGNVEQTEEDDYAEADIESDESSEESSDSEDEKEQEPKKGRILKAFEDSDDEDIQKEKITDEDNLKIAENDNPVDQNKNSQDDILQLAQVQRCYSEDLFTSQSSGKTTNEKITKASTTENTDDKIDNTQSFSIMESANAKDIVALDDNISMTFESLDDKLEPEVVELLGDLPHNLEPSQVPTTQTQGFGDDVLALCTGNFYDNKFVSQTDIQKDVSFNEIENTETADEAEPQPSNKEIVPKQKIESCDILKSILGELDSPDFEKPNKFFTGNNQSKNIEENSIKKKFVIDSDDEASESVTSKKNKKKKKKRMENRALQISDDEDVEENEDDEPESEIDDDDKEEKIIEYDSEENEVITTYNPIKPKKKAVTDFFEDEAELSSNEEWSGDEDERGLDRMEREEGDQDHFHQGKLQKELGIIHMREVLDQDKREVRMIQELLFEDGDLGDGHRQRRFRWKNIDGVEVDFNTIQSLNPSQDDEFEMEEQWRKERYEREVFLKKMRENAKNDIEINEIPILDDNLAVNMTTVTGKDVQAEKRTIKDIPSPRKPLGLFQNNYRGSLLSRGGSSLSRLAALAAPLVDSENTNTVAAGSRNFVFATLSQSNQPKVPKRKANNEGTPRLIKKLKSEQNNFRNSLLDHLNP